MAASAPSRIRILVQIDDGQKADRDILGGVLRYAATHPDWDVRIVSGHPMTRAPGMLKSVPSIFCNTIYARSHSLYNRHCHHVTPHHPLECPPHPLPPPTTKCSCANTRVRAIPRPWR